MHAAMKTKRSVSFYERLKHASKLFMWEPLSLRQFLLAIAFALTCTAASAQNAYIANTADNTISVINTATIIVIATITVGSHPYSHGNFIGPDMPPVLTLSQWAMIRSDFCSLGCQ
jgi:YVTN family beta-propeller protein